MKNASATLDPAFLVIPVSRRTFGCFVEHLGRSVYTGIHEPGRPIADADGFRGDVLELARELGVSTVRYPGGSFVSAYRWRTTSARSNGGRGAATWPGTALSPTRWVSTSSCAGPPGRAAPRRLSW